MNCRGVYGHFDRDNGSYRKSKNILPIYALKRGSTLWWGHVKQWRPTLDGG
ncbi:MAG: hypothetical protein IKA70_00805 [Alistipes sp.]|nr:hypothetical protein [Alistipes sp.]